MSADASLVGQSSTGHTMSNSAFIDAHYAVSRKSYEATLRAVGIQPGWHVLDAGCGSGSFFPLLAELVGEQGRITGCDLAPENVAQAATIAQKLGTPITAEVGNVLHLSYADNTFDAVWNANVSQYLSDQEMAQMLRELTRVVKPSGIVAIKEYDFSLMQFYPFNRFVFFRPQEINEPKSEAMRRVFTLPTWLRRAGLVDVRQQTFLEEIRAPLEPYVHTFLTAAMQSWANNAETLGLSTSDLAQWRLGKDPHAPDNPINHPDFYFREGCTLIVGIKPRG